MLCLSGFELYSRWVPLFKQQRRRLRTRHSKSEFALLPTLIGFFHLVEFVKFWSCVLKDCIKVQEKKKKVVALCARPPQNVKLLIFTSKSCRDDKKKVQKSVMDVQSCYFANLNPLFFAILVAVAVVVA